MIEQPIQPVFYEAFVEIQASTSGELIAAAERELGGLATKSPLAGQRVSAHVSSGFPVQEILALAERGRHDLIVMGSHGLTGIAHLLLGSVTERVVRAASCPVLTVKTPAAEPGTD